MAQIACAKTDKRRPIYVAHRAGNSVAGLQAATDAGIDWVELDLWWQHGRLLARHERTIWRLPVLYDKWRMQLALRPFCLDEICQMSEAGPHLLLDLKGSTGRLPEDAILTLRTQNALGRATLCGQNWSLLDAVNAIEPALPLLYSLETPKQLAAIRDRQAGPNPVRGVSCQERLLTNGVIEWMQSRALEIFAWTVNDCARAQQLAELGVAGIISDRVSMLTSLMRCEAVQFLDARRHNG